MAATEASAAPVVQEDGKTPESKPTEAEQPTKTANSETVNNEVVEKDSTVVNSEVVEKDGTAVNSEVAENKETVNNDTSEAGAEEAAGGEDAATENTSSVEPKTSFLDSFLNKSGLGKVMAGRKKKEPAVPAGGEESTAEAGGEKEGEKAGEEAAAAEGGAEGGAEGEAATEKAVENGEKEEEKKSKTSEAKSTVRDLIRKPVARIFSHRSTEKKEGAAGEPLKQVKVRSKSLDRMEDAEGLNTTADSTTEEGAAAAEEGAEGGAEEEQKASSSSATTKHMKRWHSFKKLMAQKAHKKSAGVEDVKEEGADGEGGGGDSSTLDSKESGQKRWKLKRSWTFQGLKRDPSVVGISGKAKGSDKEGAEKSEEAGEGEGGEEAKAEGEAEEAGGAEASEEKTDGGEEEKAAGGTVTQHANEIWTSFKKRVIPKSKRANTECAPSGEDDAAAAAGDDAAVEEGKDGKSAKAKRTHFGRAVSLKNFILRKGKSTSVDLGEGAKEEEEVAAEGTEGGEAAGEATAAAEGETPVEATNNEAEKTPAVEKEEAEKKPTSEKEEAEKTPADAPVTNGENGCTNGTAEENGTNNHDDEEKTTASSPVKKTKDATGAKDEANNAKIINTTAVNSDKKAGNV